MMLLPDNSADAGQDFDNLTSLFADEIRMMMATLKMSRSGGLSVAECENLDLQAGLFEYFQQRLADEGIYLYSYQINEDQLNLVNNLSRLTDQPRFKNLELTGKYSSIVIFVHGLERLSQDGRTRFFQLLNFLRDRFAFISQPIVLWARPSHVTEMARSAPDFWSWKGELFSFPSDSFEVAAAKEIRSGKLPPTTQYTRAILQDPDYSIWADLYLPLKAVLTSETFHAPATRQHFTDDELARLQRVFPQTETASPGQMIVRQGETGQDCYVLLRGEVEVIITDAAGRDVPISHLKRGDFFGEIALIKNVPRTASIKATRPGEYLRLTKPMLRAEAGKIANLLALMGDVAEQRYEAIAQATPETMSPLRRFASQQSLSQPTPTDAVELVNQNERTVVLGDAGTGKTTLLRTVTLRLAQNAQERLLKKALPLDLLPIYIRLNSLKSAQSIEDLILDVLRGYGFVEFDNEEDIKQLLRGEKQDILQTERFALIMDGLNEIPGDMTRLGLVSRFIDQYPRHRYILSCRTQDYRPIRGFKTIQLERLTRHDIEAFLVKYMGRERGHNVARHIYADRQLVDLAQTPLALYMFTQITKQGTKGLPKNRGLLFEDFTENLLERVDSEWWKLFGRSKSATPLSLRKGVLARLGYEMQKAQTFSLSKNRWLKLIAHEIARYKKNTPGSTQFATVRLSTLEDIHDEITFSGLVRFGGGTNTANRIEFAHHSYQEFFAAQLLKYNLNAVANLIATPEGLNQWRGVIILLYGIATDKLPLFATILGDAYDYARIWLAAQCLASSGEEIALATEQLEQRLPESQRFSLLFAVGLASYQAGRYAEALTYLLSASELKPDNAEVQYELGALYRQLNQYPRAITHLEEAIRLRSDFVDAYNQLGITYHNQGKYEEALTIFMATTQLEPTNAYHYFNLGTVQKILKDYHTAYKTFRIAVELKPDYAEAAAQADLLQKALASGVIHVLKSIPMLSKLTLEQSIMLSNQLEVTEYKAGSIVFHMGEMGDTFYIIESGRVQVLAPDIQRRTSTGASHIINELQAGDFFGEIALLRSVPRTATIRCATDVRLLELSREEFEQIINHHPSIAHNLAETSGSRLMRDRQAGRPTKADEFYDPSYLQELLERQNEVTVVMGDIHGSTFLTNSVGPELMIDFLDEYLLRMSNIIVNAGGAMDKSLGDSVMGVFGKYPDRPGESATSPAMRALFATLQMREAYLTLREEWTTKSPMFAETGMGIGISTGPVSIGTVGAEGAMVGAAVNLSNKLSKMAIKGRQESEIYIDQHSYQMLGDVVEVEQLDPNYVLGKSGGVPMNAFRVKHDAAITDNLASQLP